MRDVNAVKKASSDNSRVLNCFRRAVDSFWPDKAAHMRTVLLQTPPDSADCSDTLRSTSRYEQFVSFRRLVTGALCAWQECWSLLETVSRRTTYYDADIELVTKSLYQLKTDLIREIVRRRYRPVVMRVFSLHSTYLHLQARKIGTYITNPRLLSILAGIRCSDPLVFYRPTCVSVAQQKAANIRLKFNFSLQQRDNIDDFLVHLEEYFQPKTKDSMEKKTWLICEQGLLAGSIAAFELSDTRHRNFTVSLLTFLLLAMHFPKIISVVIPMAVILIIVLVDLVLDRSLLFERVNKKNKNVAMFETVYNPLTIRLTVKFQIQYTCILLA